MTYCNRHWTTILKCKAMFKASDIDLKKNTAGFRCVMK